MRMRDKTDNKAKGSIIIRKEEVVEGGHHGGSWKVAYADFVTAMMAFFLLMWLLNATTEEQRKGLADYFSPSSVLSHNSSGTGQTFGGRTAYSRGAMLSDLGNPQVMVGQHPVVDPSRKTREIVLSRGRIATTRKEADLGAAAASRHRNRCGRPLRPALYGRRHHGGPRRCSAHADRGGAAGGGGSARNRPSSRRRSRLRRRATIRTGGTGAPAGDRYDARACASRSATPTASRCSLDRRCRTTRPGCCCKGGAGADPADAGRIDRRPPTRPRLPVSRTNWELSADRANATRRLLINRACRIADPQCDRQCRARPCGARDHGRRQPPTPSSLLGAPCRKHREAIACSRWLIGLLLFCVFGSYLVSGSGLTSWSRRCRSIVDHRRRRYRLARDGQQHARTEARDGRLQEDLPVPRSRKTTTSTC
jgi:chemotaxis protein MotB